MRNTVSMTEIMFDLKENNGSTVLLFAQRGWKEQVEFMHYCPTKWATYLLRLKRLCEGGTGTPYPDDTEIGSSATGTALLDDRTFCR